MMHFTLWIRENPATRGMEMLCDWCNKSAIDNPVGLWYYQRYNIFDEYPSNWVCHECKESVE
tara:strand:- start:170 stop:355 length:186 start_codon:yes stop_codon:yes gene_type:complete